MRVVIRGCWALMADEREDPDFDMMVYDGHLDKSMKLRKEKIKALPFPAYIPDSNPSLRKYHHTALLFPIPSSFPAQIRLL